MRYNSFLFYFTIFPFPNGSVLEEKSSFKMLGLTFSSKWDRGSYIISIAKTVSKKIGSLIRSMKFLSPEVALYLYKSTICPCMEYCCHVWAGAPSCYLEMLDKLQKWIWWLLVPHLLLLLKTLAHCRNVASLIVIFLIDILQNCSSGLVPLPFVQRRSTRNSDRLLNFSVTILDVTRVSMATVSFLAQLDSGIPCL